MPSFSGAFAGGGEPGADGYARLAAQLLPPGRLFSLDADAKLPKLLEALTDEFARIALRAETSLLDEADPRTASETLPEWEQFLSLPDDRVPTLPSTEEGRRVVLAQKLVRRGGQKYAFFEALCTACGYPLLGIELYADKVLRAGFRVGARVLEANWACSMRLTLGPATPGALTQTQMRAVIRGATHAHVLPVCIFT